MPETLKKKTAKGLLWGGLSNGMVQLLTLVFGVILSRKLSQADYGMIGMLAIFSAVAACMQEGGFISALNRKENVTHRDYNAVFWTSVFTSIAFYVLFFFTAPLIAGFYNESKLIPLARYSFLSFLFVSFSIAPRAYMFRNMMVRQSSIISIVSVLLSGIVGVVMAMNGFAYWGIATQQIVYTLSVSILNYYFSGWRPTWRIDLRPIREILGFSSKLIATNILTSVNTNLLPVILGHSYTAQQVGDFTQGNKWSTMGHSFITNMLYSVAQPVLTKTYAEKERQKHVFRKLLRFTAFVSFPIMLCLALVSKELIVILITERWLNSAYILQVLCFSGAVMPISYLFSNLLITRGRSTTYMWCTVALLLAQLLVLWGCVPYGIGCMVQAYTALNIVWLIVWFFLAHNEINLRLTEAIKDVGPYVTLSIVYVCITYVVTFNVTNIYPRLILKILFFGICYCGTLWVLHSTIFYEAIMFITKKKLT